MRGGVTIAAFVVLVALVTASGQRGGVRASGGGHGGFGGRGGAVGHASGGPAFGAMHAASGAHSHFREGGFRGVHFRTFRNHCHGCRWRYGYPAYWGYAGYYAPYGWWDSSSSYDLDEDRAREISLANEMNALSLEEQRMREREDWERERYEDVYARRAQPREEERAAVAPATVLVFRDQHQQEVRNYAIAGGTLWVLSEQAAKKIPLTDLDLAATMKVNDERGTGFQVPK